MWFDENEGQGQGQETAVASQPSHQSLVLRAPTSLDKVRPVDLVVCSGCGVVVSLHEVTVTERLQLTAEELEVESVRDLDLDCLSGARVVQEDGEEVVEVEGVFCPNCEQMLFDRETWTVHVAERMIFDREQR